MVTLLVDATGIEVVLSPTERATSFHGASIHISRGAIERVQLVDDLWTWIRGTRKPGTYVPRVIAAGTWRSVSGSDFVMVRGRKPGVIIELAPGEQYSRLLLTTRHGLALVAALQSEVDVQVIDGEATAPAPKRKPRTRPATA